MLNRRAWLTGALAVGFATPAWAAVTRGEGRFPAALRYARERGGTGLLIMRHGIVLAEDTGDLEPASLRPMGEATRILVPLLAAALVADDLIDLDELVAQSLEGWASDPRRTSISVRSLLNMTSGVGMGVPGSDIPSFVEAARAELLADTATQFSEDAAPIHLFAEIARRKVVGNGRDADLASYLGRRIFDPIGVNVVLNRDTTELPLLSTGGQAALPDWAKLADLIRRGGIHSGRSLVSGTVLRDARVGSFLQPRYGLGLWLGARPRAAGERGLDLTARDGSIPADTFGVGGADGCRIYAVPAASVVVARASTGGGNASTWSDATLLQAALAGI